MIFLICRQGWVNRGNFVNEARNSRVRYLSQREFPLYSSDHPSCRATKTERMRPMRLYFYIAVDYRGKSVYSSIY